MTSIDVERVLAVNAAASAFDGVSPLDEATLIALAEHPDLFSGVVEDAGFALIHGTALSVAVVPDAREQGVGSRLVGTVLGGFDTPLRGYSTNGKLTAWMHGESAAARALAARFGFEATREMWVMRRAVADVGLVDVPDGLVLRGFLPGDEGEILRVNAAAFAWHPEQASMDLDDLAARMRQPWFDAAGLLGLWDGGTLLGFHWTKRHPVGTDGRTHGEIYVIAVDPAAHGRGLGRLLTLAGLEVMGDCDEVLLYVEADNTVATRLYASLGFRHEDADTHVQFTRLTGA